MSDEHETLSPSDFNIGDYFSAVYFPTDQILVFRVVAKTQDSMLGFCPVKKVGYAVFEDGIDFRWLQKIDTEDLNRPRRSNILARCFRGFVRWLTSLWE